MVYKSYSWRVHHGVPAEDAGKVMEELMARDGEVTKESFLEASRPEDSPTHGCFEWDDTVAAESYRLHQSQLTILDLKVTISKDGEESLSGPAVVNVSIEKHAAYQDTWKALSVEDSRKVVLRNALNELESFKAKYSALAELAEVFSAIGNVSNAYKEA